MRCCSIIILSIFLFPFQGFSQFENTGFGLAVNYSHPHSTYEYRFFARKPLPAWDETFGAYAYCIDIHTFYKINSKFSIKTGAGFVKNKFLYNPELYFSDQVTIKKGFDRTNKDWNLIVLKHFTSLNYISLPIGINYKLNSRWEIGAGIQNNFLLSAYQYSYLIFESGRRDSRFYHKSFTNEEYNKYVLSAYAEVNCNFKVYEFPLKARMQVGYGVSNYFSKEISGTLYPYTMSFGLATKFTKK